MPSSQKDGSVIPVRYAPFTVNRHLLAHLAPSPSSGFRVFLDEVPISGRIYAIGKTAAHIHRLSSGSEEFFDQMGRPAASSDRFIPDDQQGIGQKVRRRNKKPLSLSQERKFLSFFSKSSGDAASHQTDRFSYNTF